MNGGAFGENFPYTNFHDLNLDWIIKEIKESRATIEDFRETLNQLNVDVEEFRQYIENLDEEIDDKIQNQIPVIIDQLVHEPEFIDQVTDTVTETVQKRRIIIIGDSYGAGWTPDGEVTGFPGLVKFYMGIPDEDFFNANKGGAKFGAAEGNEYAFDTVLNNLLPSITNKDTITDIIFVGGYNDAWGDVDVINAGIRRCEIIIENTFHNPSLHRYICSVGYHCSDPEIRDRLFYRYRYCYARSPFAYNPIETSICQEDWWASDGYHPLQFAQNAIAGAIRQMLFGNSYNRSLPRAYEYATTDAQNRTFYIELLYDAMYAFIYGGSIPFTNMIRLNRTTPVKVLTITTLFPLVNSTDESKRDIYTFPVILEINRASFAQTHLHFFFKQESRTTYGLYAFVYALNENNTGYAEYQNVSSIMFATNTLTFRIPYKF